MSLLVLCGSGDGDVVPFTSDALTVNRAASAPRTPVRALRWIGYDRILRDEAA